MNKTILLLLTIFTFCSVNAQKKNDISNYNSKKPQYGFIENKGQIHDQNYKANPDVKFLLCLGNGMNVQLKKNSFSYDTYKKEVKEIKNSLSLDLMRPFEQAEKEITYYYHRVDVELIGANYNPEIIAEESSVSYLNYYNAVTPECGATNVHSYNKITYKNIYSGIDMVFEAYPTKEKAVEYTFIVHPGADANQIKLHYIGANKTELNGNKINITVAHGFFSENIPASWIKETNLKVDVSFKEINNNIYSFNIPSYINSQTLIIDPNPDLSWATYYGGSDDDIGSDVYCDINDNTFLTGNTKSNNAIATTGAFQDSCGGNFDVFIVKFSSTGNCLWGTYYGGSAMDQSIGIISDANGDVYVTGTTLSQNAISTSNAHQTLLDGNQNAYIIKLNSNGVRQWGTYYGGNYDTYGGDLASDIYGNIFLIGMTKSDYAIATPGSYQPIFGGISDAFIAKFNTNGERKWGTYFGGFYGDSGGSIAIDDNGNIYIVGSTLSIESISTPGSHQIDAGGNYDAFIAKLDSNGVRQWGTYYGGSNIDYGRGIVMDNYGNIFISGSTRSIDGIFTSGAFQNTTNGGFAWDLYIVKFNNSGVRAWGTYFGGWGESFFGGLACDNANNIYLTGSTRCANLIATPNSYQPIKNADAGTTDGFLVKFNNNGIRDWGTYFGGLSSTEAKGISCDNNSNIYISGQTQSDSAIATPGAHQTIIGDHVYRDAFIAKFLDNTSGFSENSNSLSNFNIYPNPVTNELIIECFEKINNQHFEIINSLGQIVINGIISEKTKVQTTDFATGIYILKLEQNKNFEFKKIIKQ